MLGASSDHMNESEEKQLEGKVQGSAGARSVQASAQDTAGGDEEVRVGAPRTRSAGHELLQPTMRAGGDTSWGLTLVAVSRCALLFVQTKDAGDTESKVDTSVLRILRMSAFKAGWILIGMLGALVYGTQYPMFSLAFAEIVNLFFEPKISTMRSDGEFWSIMFLILGFVSCASRRLVVGVFLVLCVPLLSHDVSVVPSPPPPPNTLQVWLHCSCSGRLDWWGPT